MAEHIYMPTLIVIPDELPYKRAIRNNYFDFMAQSQQEADTSNYDFKTLFYDVFFSSDNTQICAVGPPFLNLGQELPFEILYKGESLPYLLTDYRQCSLLSVESQIEEKEVELVFDFKHFKEVVLLKKEEKLLRPNFAVVACQKNNKPRWLKSWCEWYTKLYNAAIYLYDNGSEDFPAVVKAVEEYNPTIVKWDFKFGPYSTLNRFCQVGAYNHFRLKYNFKYGLVFDIDEYLISKASLSDYLELQGDVSLFMLDNYYIPNVREEKENFGIEDFHYRPNKLRGKGSKYIFLRQNMRYLDVHSASPYQGRILSVPGDLIYFNHYKGLSTHWKPWDHRERIESHTEDHILDTEARNLIEKLKKQ